MPGSTVPDNCVLGLKDAGDIPRRCDAAINNASGGRLGCVFRRGPLRWRAGRINDL
jgi:hypothetical protein